VNDWIRSMVGKQVEKDEPKPANGNAGEGTGTPLIRDAGAEMNAIIRGKAGRVRWSTNER